MQPDVGSTSLDVADDRGELFGRREVDIGAVLVGDRCMARGPVEALPCLVQLVPIRVRIRNLPSSMYPQCGHGHRSPGSPTSAGPRSTPFANRMNDIVIVPTSVMRTSTPSPAILIGTSSALIASTSVASHLTHLGRSTSISSTPIPLARCTRESAGLARTLNEADTWIGPGSGSRYTSASSG